MWESGAFSPLFRHIFLRLEAKGRFQRKRKEKQRNQTGKCMELYFVGGKSLSLLSSGESRFEIKRRTEKREAGEYMREIACGGMKNIYKKKKEQGHVMGESENKNRQSFLPSNFEKRRRFVTFSDGTCVCLSGNFR